MTRINQIDTDDRLNVKYVKTVWGSQWQCEAGQHLRPIGCERHSEHYWCKTCRGFFGVPHIGIHSGRGKHPTSTSARDCACIVCKEERGAK